MFPAFGQDSFPPEHSTTGPAPPPGVVSEPVSGAKSVKTIAGVPAYLWRHGCGPTAVGMVVGYWDGQGLSALIPGSAAAQTPEVQQAIASGGTSASPMTPEQHYEDYGRPEDSSPNPMLTDDYITASRTPHADNCIADFMRTSRSSDPYLMHYGGSWSTYVIPSFTSFAAMNAPSYVSSATQYSFSSGTLSFQVVKTEIDNNRPMVFLVDSTGDGVTDHFVPVIGYDDGPPQRYIYYNTWDLDPHQVEFREMVNGFPWGVKIAWSFNISDPNGFRFVERPQGGWFEEGETLSLNVVVAGGVGQITYQWVKDGVDIPGETSASLDIAALTDQDQGWYVCRVTDESKSLHETTPVFAHVSPAGSLPVAGTMGTGLAILACAVAGLARLRRRQR
jgi:hypothetical protein